MRDSPSPDTARQDWMSLLAKAPAAQVAKLVAPIPDWPDFDWLRSPEIGGVMVRGRMGGAGAAFNIGEVTVTRCALRLPTGEVGHGYVQGRDRIHAQNAALIDALMQTARAAEIRDAVLDRLAAAAQARRAERARKAGATKVEFFTMVRGED